MQGADETCAHRHAISTTPCVESAEEPRGHAVMGPGALGKRRLSVGHSEGESEQEAAMRRPGTKKLRRADGKSLTVSFNQTCSVREVFAGYSDFHSSGSCLQSQAITATSPDHQRLSPEPVMASTFHIPERAFNELLYHSPSPTLRGRSSSPDATLDDFHCSEASEPAQFLEAVEDCTKELKAYDGPALDSVMLGIMLVSVMQNDGGQALKSCLTSLVCSSTAKMFTATYFRIQGLLARIERSGRAVYMQKNIVLGPEHVGALKTLAAISLSSANVVNMLNCSHQTEGVEGRKSEGLMTPPSPRLEVVG